MRKSLNLSSKQVVLDPNIDNSRPSSALVNLHVGLSTPPMPPSYLASPSRSTKFHLSQELKKLELREQLLKASTTSLFDDSVAGSSDWYGTTGDIEAPDQQFENSADEVVRVRSEDLSPGPSIAPSTAPSVAPDANSLFTRSDQQSLEKYMQEIEARESCERHSQEDLQSKDNYKMDHQSLQSGYHFQELSTDSTPLNRLTFRYNNLGHWKANTVDPKVRVLNMKLSEDIVMREALLIRLEDVLGRTDVAYWKYCTIRIKCTEYGEAVRSLKSNDLRRALKLLRNLQNEISALIAQVRSLAVAIIENVGKLRRFHRKKFHSTAQVSVYWSGVNYLLKIKHDMLFLFDYPTMRIWLGFVPKDLLMPPVSKTSTSSLFDPKNFWRLHGRKHYEDWYKRHEDYITHCWDTGRTKVVIPSDRKFLREEIEINGFQMTLPSRDLLAATATTAGTTASTRQLRSGSVSPVPVSTPPKTPPTSMPSVLKKSSSKALQDIAEESETHLSDSVSPPIGIAEQLITTETNCATKAEETTKSLIETSTSNADAGDVIHDDSNVVGTGTPLSKDDNDLQHFTSQDAKVNLLTPSPFPELQNKERRATFSPGVNHSPIWNPQQYPYLNHLMHPNDPLHERRQDPDLQQDPLEDWQQLQLYATYSWGTILSSEELRQYAKESPGEMDIMLGREVVLEFKRSNTAAPSTLISGAKEATINKWEKSFLPTLQQGVDAAPMFWNSIDHNPLVVEAAVGFEETFPLAPIIPSMPDSLVGRVLEAENSLRIEMRNSLAFHELNEKSKNLKSDLEDSTLAQNLAQIASGAKLEMGKQDVEQLKLRQQGSSETLAGICADHVTKSLHLSAADATNFISKRKLNVHPEPLVVEPDPLLSSQKDEIVNVQTFFITDVPRQQTSVPDGRKGGMMAGDGAEDCTSNELFDKSHMIANLHAHGGYVDFKDFQAFRIEQSSMLRQRIEDAVGESLRIIEYKEGALFPTIRENKCNREPVRTDGKWEHKQAMQIQRVVRGFLGRIKGKERYKRRNWRLLIVKTQCLVRGFLARNKEKKRKWEQDFKTFLLRKQAARRFKASIVLTSFFKRIVRARRELMASDEIKVENHQTVAKAVRQLRIAYKLPSQSNSSRAKFRLKAGAVAKSASIDEQMAARRRHQQKLITDNLAQDIQEVMENALSQDGSLASIDTSHYKSGAKDREDEDEGSVLSGLSFASGTRRQKSKKIDEDDLSQTGSLAGIEEKPSISSVMRRQEQEDKAKDDDASIGTASTGDSKSNSTLRSLRRRKAEQDRKDRDAIGAENQEALLGASSEAKRREKLKAEAISLIARVNRGKPQLDTLYNSRLIPSKAQDGDDAVRVKKFATKERALFCIPGQAKPQSLLNSSTDAYVGPIPKRLPPVPTPRPDSANSIASVTSPARSASSAEIEEAEHSLPVRTDVMDSTADLPSMLAHRVQSAKLGLSPTVQEHLLRNSKSQIDLFPQDTNTPEANALHRTSATIVRAGANLLSIDTSIGEGANNCPNKTLNPAASAPALGGSPVSWTLQPRTGTESGPFCGSKASATVPPPLHPQQKRQGHMSVSASAAQLLSYNSSGMSNRAKRIAQQKQKAEQERQQLRSALRKYV